MWQSKIKENWDNTTVGDLFSRADPSGKLVMDLLIDSFWQAQERECGKAIKDRSFPHPWQASVEIGVRDAEIPPLIITLRGIWRIYRAKLEGHLLNGTYVFDTDRFVGSQTYPFIDMRESEPGPDWERVNDYPDRLLPGTGLALLQGGNARELILQNFGCKRLCDLAE